MISQGLDIIRNKKKLPDKPGVYFFLDNKEEILYIGKATSLRDRVKSYFSGDLFESRGPLIVEMLSKIKNIKWQETDSVLEALILEANLIKKYQPKYNTKDKSDKSFNYVCITKEDLPKVILVRERELEKNCKNLQKNFYNSFLAIFGPFPNGGQLKEAMKIIRKIIPFLDEKSKNYLEFYRQINLAPDLDDKKMYRQNIRNLILFFEGKKKKILKNLEKEMKEYAKKKEFEKAGETKRQIFALKHINDVALIKNSGKGQPLGISERAVLKESFFRIEAYDVAHLSGKNMVGVMTVLEDGEAAKNEYRKFKIRTQGNANDTGALAEVLERRLAHPEWPYPNLIVVDGNSIQINAAQRILIKFNLDIPIVGVVKDERHKPKDIVLSLRPDLKGAQGLAFRNKYENEILLANSEAHRFAISYHKNLRTINFLK